jgi:TonB family protein
MRTFLSVLLFTLVLLCGGALADGKKDSKKEQAVELNESYAEFQKLAEAQKWQESLPYIQRSYELGVELLGQKKEMVVIAFDYGMNLKAVRNYSVAAQILKSALTAGEAVYGKDSTELIPILTNLGSVMLDTGQNKDYKPYYDRAVQISEKAHGKESVETAKLMLNFVDNVLRLDGPRQAKDYVHTAYEILKKQLGDKDKLTGLAAFFLGKYCLMQQDFRKAKSHFQETLNTFDNPDAPDSQMELITHGFLVEVNERLDNSEEATRHCLAIGRMTPVKDTQNYFPVFRLEPEYPPTAARKREEGFAMLEFTVDASGFVVDPKVIESSDPIFEKPSLDAIKKFRFAPRFVDGKPVAVPGVRNKIVYQIAQH